VNAETRPLLLERAAIAGLSPQGTTSWSGGARLLPAADGWVALSLTRPDDVELVPALVEDEVRGSAWPAVTRCVAARRAQDVVSRGVLLGLPIAALGEASELPAVIATRTGDAPARALAGAVVVDFSALWAGPLCGSRLAEAGANVIKVESASRPDGARAGPLAFFDLMNANKRAFAVDFADPEDRALLQRLVDRADVVIEASRRRALDQLGIDRTGAQVWLTITGYGRDVDRVAFGDDAAVAGGLVEWRNGEPHFVGDAIADPLSGLTAAEEIAAALERGGRWTIDIAMAGVAAASRATLGDLPTPRAREPIGRAPELGAHTAEIVAELGL
jgi:hypothetical protein